MTPLYDQHKENIAYRLQDTSTLVTPADLADTPLRRSPKLLNGLIPLLLTDVRPSCGLPQRQQLLQYLVTWQQCRSVRLSSMQGRLFLLAQTRLLLGRLSLLRDLFVSLSIIFRPRHVLILVVLVVCGAGGSDGPLALNRLLVFLLGFALVAAAVRASSSLEAASGPAVTVATSSATVVVPATATSIVEASAATAIAKAASAATSAAAAAAS